MRIYRTSFHLRRVSDVTAGVSACTHGHGRPVQRAAPVRSTEEEEEEKEGLRKHQSPFRGSSFISQCFDGGEAPVEPD